MAPIDTPEDVPKAREEAMYEVEDPDFDETVGSFKTNNPGGDRWQRVYIHISPKMSRFKKTVQMILCLHGWETPAKTQPMTLLIFSVKLNCHSSNFRFQSVRMWLAFDEDNKAVPPNTEKASPAIVGYAPFVRDEMWNESSEDIVEKNAYGGELGVEHMAAAKANTSKEKERSYTRKHFDRGSADPLVDAEQRLYMEQNKLTDYGVKPHFHLAVLLKRSHSQTDPAKPISFSGVFDMQAEAGFIHDFEQGARRLFRLGRQEDEAIYFDGETDRVTGREGAKISQRVDKERLGELLEGDHLSKLLDGDEAVGEKMLEGLEPLEPSGA
ncbi:uncharacterized protein DNG_06155 [Cephalotrichum gorgonifer]|uniref:Uncharacterized protein n=1 Tax=Cephalotrichum gorgonifer TaxID=2041049 RepID=A0AAE8MZG0_9PEZI|nr:uncharacterized protein DNG_06155 [Cephalotrichum gorgonifer]